MHAKPPNGPEVDLAPVSDLTRYLDLLHRALVAIRTYGLARGEDEALFCGLVADALHNLPDLLLRFRQFDQQQFWREVSNLRTQVPPRLVRAWDVIFGSTE
jgi:hypothetical protein